MTTAQRRQIALQKTTMTQQRLNRYFHAEVMPNLTNCWSRLQGRGTIEIAHSYTKDVSGKWIADKLTVGKSTLPRGQDAVALQCMQDSVRGTSFSSDSGDGKGDRYLVNWTWPVPFPSDATTLTSAMFAAKPKRGGSGCDGRGAPAQCFICDQKSCLRVCVGYKTCREYTSGEGAKFCTESDDCASGGPFGLIGGGVIQ